MSLADHLNYSALELDSTHAVISQKSQVAEDGVGVRGKDYPDSAPQLGEVNL